MPEINSSIPLGFQSPDIDYGRDQAQYAQTKLMQDQDKAAQFALGQQEKAARRNEDIANALGGLDLNDPKAWNAAVTKVQGIDPDAAMKMREFMVDPSPERRLAAAEKEPPLPWAQCRRAART